VVTGSHLNFSFIRFLLPSKRVRALALDFKVGLQLDEEKFILVANLTSQMIGTDFCLSGWTFCEDKDNVLGS